MRPCKQSRSSKHLNLKLPHRKLKLSRSSHQLHSPRALFCSHKENSLIPQPPALCNPPQPVILQVEDLRLLESLKCYPIRRKHQYFKEGMSLQGIDFIVLSKIEEFSGEYNRYAKTVDGHCRSIKWIILSNAVNNQVVQQQFNSLYEPIKFVFLRSIAAAVNFINFEDKNKIRSVELSFFSEIINFEAFRNDYGCIMQEDRQNLGLLRVEKNILWLIGQQDLQTLKSIKAWYYILDRHALVQNKLRIVVSSDQLIYIAIQSHQQILKGAAADERQKDFDKTKVREKLLNNLNTRYCEKVVAKYLLEEIVYALIKFPPQISKELSKHLSYVAPVSSTPQLTNSSLYCIYYDSKDQQNPLGFEYNKEDKVINQAYRIKNHFSAMHKIVRSYKLLRKQIDNYPIVSYKLTDSQLLREISYLTGKRVRQITSIEDLQSFQQTKIIVIGCFIEAQKETLLPSLLDCLIDYQKCQQNNLIVHNQVLIQLQALNKTQKSLRQFEQSPKVISFNVEMPEFSSEPIYVNKQLCQFKSTLMSIEENYHHLIIMPIEDYHQQYQKNILQTEKLHNVTIQVYLKYGKEFILRSRRQKYEFLKRDQLITKIHQIIRLNQRSWSLPKKQPQQLQLLEHQDYQQKIYSTMLSDNYFEPNYLSTPSLQQVNQKQLFILIPKTVPYHSLLNRSNQEYTLLTYGTMQQAYYFSRHLYKHIQAIAIVQESQRLRNLENISAVNFSYVKVKHLGQKEIRDQIDKIVQSFGLTKKLGSISKARTHSHNMVLYDSQDQRQAKLISSINTIFRNSKIFTLPKSQFIQIKSRYNIIENLTVFELGNPYLSSSRKIRNVIDLLKVFMSPSQASIQFTSQHLTFSRRQLFIRQYIQKSKKAKIKGRLGDLSSSRCTSPRSKSLLGKESLFEPGMVILQSSNIGLNSKRQKISTKYELIRAIFEQLNKGNHLIVVLSQAQQNTYRNIIQKRPSGIFWILVSKKAHKNIVKESHLIYCATQQVPIVLSSINSRFKQIKQTEFIIMSNQNACYSLDDIFVATVFEKWQDFTKYLLPTDDAMNIVKDMNKQLIELQQLNGALVFRGGGRLESIKSLFSGQQTQKNTCSDSNQMIIILARAHNRQFIERCLLILKEKSCLLVTYRQLDNIILHVQITRTLLVMEESDFIFKTMTLRLNPCDTPASFSPKLAGFIASLRKDT